MAWNWEQPEYVATARFYQRCGDDTLRRWVQRAPGQRPPGGLAWVVFEILDTRAA